MEDEYHIIVDNRELKSGVVKELFRLNVKIISEQLKVGDFILSSNICCERKSVEDFVNSILDNRLFKQVREMVENFDKVFLVIEGTQNIYSVRNVHANAIRGALASLALDFKIPMILTKDEKDTAQLFHTILKKEGRNKQIIGLRGEIKPLTDKELMEYIVSSFPGVGRKTAQNILEHFKTLKEFVNSGEEELMNVEGVGRIIARRIKKIIKKRYE